MAPRREKFYFHAPTTDSPVDGPIFLGAIITHPRNADSPLNSRPIPIDTNIMDVYTDEIPNYSVTLEKKTTGTLGIFASFLAQILGIGGDVTGERGNTDSENWTCESLKTTSFNPTPEYIKSSLESSAVKQFLEEDKGWLLSSKVYMITGLKLAYGATGTIEYAKSKGINLHLSLDATSLGVPVEAGPEFGINRENKLKQEFGKKTPFVLAFRMRKINVTPGGKITNKPVTGGMLGTGSSESDAGEDGEAEQPEYIVDGLDEEDADANEFDIKGSWEVAEELQTSVVTCGCSLAAEP
ncbi:hypothetical protein BDV96DRAFT_587990 [Lophiotrema nucula]|uniref:Uncharacterized protein n=1 Tax=Lophiotrema nucula TaxID=690887 RepID=A0A6A5YLH8_9PLEO|nr:hypothetical protein BDV96DRAFT_587990 [Lophiotrema nucula]